MLKRATRILLTSAGFAAFGLVGVYIGYSNASAVQVIYQPATECEWVGEDESPAI